MTGFGTTLPAQQQHRPVWHFIHTLFPIRIPRTPATVLAGLYLLPSALPSSALPFIPYTSPVALNTLCSFLSPQPWTHLLTILSIFLLGPLYIIPTSSQDSPFLPFAMATYAVIVFGAFCVAFHALPSPSCLHCCCTVYNHGGGTASLAAAPGRPSSSARSCLITRHCITVPDLCCCNDIPWFTPLPYMTQLPWFSILHFALHYLTQRVLKTFSHLAAYGPLPWDSSDPAPACPCSWMMTSFFFLPYLFLDYLPQFGSCSNALPYCLLALITHYQRHTYRATTSGTVLVPLLCQPTHALPRPHYDSYYHHYTTLPCMALLYVFLHLLYTPPVAVRALWYMTFFCILL